MGLADYLWFQAMGPNTLVAFTCRQLRGGLFEANTSSTWQNIGYFQLDLDANLGFSGYGDYGWDNIALDEVTVSPHQAIAVVNSTEYWLGYLGLGIRHINFTNDNDLTYLSTLVENQSLIPSHSYGYTAGAYYRKPIFLVEVVWTDCSRP